MLEDALNDIRAFWSDHGEEEMGAESHEVEMLRTLLQQVQDSRPRSKSERLKEALDQAIRQENYEKAAALRDQLSLLQPKSKQKPALINMPRPPASK